MSIVTEEEYYRDSLSVLIDIRDIQAEIRDSLGSGIDPFGDVDVNTVYDDDNDVKSISALSENIRSVSDSISSIDVEKANAVESLLTAVAGFSVGQIQERAVESMIGISDSIASIADNISDIDIESAERFPKVLGHMGLGLVAFSAGLSASILMVGYSIMENPVGVIALAGVIALFGYTSQVIGENAVDVGKGALAMGVMGLGALAFTYGIVESSNAIMNANPLGIIALPLLTAGMGLIYNVIGKNAGSIAMGALAVGAMGASLWIFGEGMQSIDEVFKEDNDILWQFPALIVEVGLAYAGAGSITPLILAGALSIGAMGASLYAFGAGVGSVQKLDMSDVAETSSTMSYAITQFSEAYAIAGSTDGMSKLFGFNVGRNDVERGIDSTMRMGRNMMMLSRGIGEWKNMNLQEGDLELIKGNIESILFTIPAIFSVIGANERGSSNQVKIKNPFGGGDFQFGVPFTKTDTELGISSTMKIGSNLTELYRGVDVWRKGKISENDIELIKGNVESMLFTIPAIFSAIGSADRGSTNQIKIKNPFGGGDFQFGVPFTKSDTELGIKVSEGIGGTLTKLYDGVSSWKVGGKNDISKDLGNITENITNILTVIPNAFKKIGELANEDSKFFGMIDGSMEDGVELVGRMTEPLLALSGIIKSYTSESDFTSGSKNMGRALVTISTSMDSFTSKRIDALSDLNDQFGNLNKNLREHFNIIKGIPKDELLAFDDYTKSIKLLSEVRSKELVEGLKAHNKEIASRREPTIVVQNTPWNASGNKGATISGNIPQYSGVPSVTANKNMAQEQQNTMSLANVERLLQQIVSVVAKDSNVDEVRMILSQIKNELEN